VPALASFDYAVVRVVPRVEREEFINAGVILFCRTARFLAARVSLDEERLHALAPGCDFGEVRRHLDLIPVIAAGDPAGGPPSAWEMPERFHWLTAPRSTVVQVGPVHSGVTADPQRSLDRLFGTMVALPDSRSPGAPQ
jgi:hypothetical protein